MITFEPAEKKVVTREKILLDGNVIGEIWPCEHGYQCQIDVGCFDKVLFSHLTANAIAVTKDKCLEKAVADCKQSAAAYEMAYKTLSKQIKK